MRYQISISVFCDQALSSSQKYMHKYVVLKKWDLAVPILLSPLMCLGWPDTAGSRKASLTALHEMEQLQFSIRTELMTKDAQDVREHVITPRKWETWVQTLLPCPPERTGNHPSFLDSLSTKYMLACSFSPEKVIPLCKKEIKIPWAKERNSLKDLVSGPSSNTAYTIIHKISL